MNDVAKERRKNSSFGVRREWMKPRVAACAIPKMQNSIQLVMRRRPKKKDQRLKLTDNKSRKKEWKA
jgi:hypothetical protein